MSVWWVEGGVYADTTFKDVIDEPVSEGPFVTYKEAEDRWRSLSWQKVDNCHARYTVREDQTTKGRYGTSTAEPDDNGHVTRFSDSSFYDFVCVLCGATDGFGDRGLTKRCPGGTKQPSAECAAGQHTAGLSVDRPQNEVGQSVPHWARRHKG